MVVFTVFSHQVKQYLTVSMRRKYIVRYILNILIAFLFCVGGTLSAHAALDDGLILYFGFDYETGGSVIDGTGEGHDGTLTNASINTDEKKVGNGSLEMLDQNASLQVESFPELEEYQDNSFVFWLHFIQGHNGAWSQIFAKKAPGSDRSPGVWTCPNSLNIHYRFNPGNQGSQCAGPGGEDQQFETGKWHHIAGVKAGGKFHFYIDAIQVGEYDVPAAHAQGEEKLYIGSTTYRSATFYIDDFFLFNRALSGNEVSDIMEGLLTSVEPQNKLTTTWGILKTQRD